MLYKKSFFKFSCVLVCFLFAVQVPAHAQLSKWISKTYNKYFNDTTSSTKPQVPGLSYGSLYT
jgi:hypothetical protein